MNFSFLHAADIHLDSPLRGLERYPDAPVEEIRAAGRRAFDRLIELAIAEKVAFVVIAGDLYDVDWRDYHTGLYFSQRMGRLERQGIQVLLARGNHDADSVISKNLPLPENVHLFAAKRPETKLFPELGLAAHGQSYARREMTENLAASFPQAVSGFFNLGVLHTALSGRAGHDLYAPCAVADLLHKNYDYWALGHVHQRETVSERPWIVFPGNIQGRSVKECGEKGATVARVVDGAVTDVRHVALDVLRFVHPRLDVSGCARREDVFALTRQAIMRALSGADGRALALRLTLYGRSPLLNALIAQEDALREEIRAVAIACGPVWLEKLSLETEDEDDAQNADFPGADTVATLLTELRHGDFFEELLRELSPEIAVLRAFCSFLPGGGADLADADELRRGALRLLAARLGGART
ncbi:MAG: DNA repair exonuclease [Desulfobulbaceae bacterium]|jgi:DNA repair exonuclease SbcCD nuclease subunit|nr:DNA repair exonuclease [Desulfobulbaceae bacterium]